MDAFLVALPQLLFSSIMALPLAIGMILAIRHLRAGSRPRFFQHLAGSIAAGAVTLVLLWSSMFGDNLSRSSTAGLIFAVAPVYAVVAQGIFFGIVGVFFRKSTPPRAISMFARLTLIVPVLMLAVLTVGLVKTSLAGNDSEVAQRAKDPKILYQLLEKSRTGQADEFAIPFNLAQNPNAPSEMMTEFANSEHATVRAHAARHPNTPQAVVATLRNDCASFVRKVVVERLGPGEAIAPPPAPTGVCPKHWK